ncbi:helix-turn-helix domain-containing protein [bacterium]|nr:helix-turn-helix domain-containing protein [bacterium]
MNTENRHNYYEILDLTENATQQEIYAAYEKAKMTYSAENKALHSVFSSDEASALRTLVEEAYEVLSNNTYRNIYEKRMLANTFAEDDLSVEAIKTASANLFERANPPTITTQAPQSSHAPAKDLEFENEIANKKEWNGADLKKVREYRDLSFDELTDITKINPWYIAALEEMDPANLPVEVFVRGYVVQIAKALGLKDKIVADSYMRLFRKKIEN